MNICEQPESITTINTDNNFEQMSSKQFDTSQVDLMQIARFKQIDDKVGIILLFTNEVLKQIETYYPKFNQRPDQDDIQLLVNQELEEKSDLEFLTRWFSRFADMVCQFQYQQQWYIDMILEFDYMKAKKPNLEYFQVLANQAYLYLYSKNELLKEKAKQNFNNILQQEQIDLGDKQAYKAKMDELIELFKKKMQDDEIQKKQTQEQTQNDQQTCISDTKVTPQDNSQQSNKDINININNDIDQEQIQQHLKLDKTEDLEQLQNFNEQSQIQTQEQLQTEIEQISNNVNIVDDIVILQGYESHDNTQHESNAK